MLMLLLLLQHRRVEGGGLWKARAHSYRRHTRQFYRRRYDRRLRCEVRRHPGNYTRYRGVVILLRIVTYYGPHRHTHFHWQWRQWRDRRHPGDARGILVFARRSST